MLFEEQFKKLFISDDTITVQTKIGEKITNESIDAAIDNHQS